jgi:hypothetical protein
VAGFGHCQEIPRAAGRAVSKVFVGRDARHLYFTNCTLTGKQSFPVPRGRIGTGCRGGLLVKLFLAKCLPSLFHQSRFDWERESLSAFDSGSRRRCHLSVAAPSPNFFHRSHFDWEPERFSVAAFGYRQAIPQAELSATPSFARCSPSLFHQSHFDWEQSPPTPKRGFAWTCSSRISVVTGFLTAKRFRTTKCPL